MRSWMTRGVMLWLGAGLLLSTPTMAQNREKAWELTPYVGSLQFGSSSGLDDTVSWGFRFGYHWTRRHMIEFAFSGASTQDEITGNLNADLLGGQINYVLNFFLHRRDKVVAYLTGGVGIQTFSTFGFVSDPDLVGDENDLSYNVGAGIRFFGGERIGVRIDARQISYSTEAGGSQDQIEISAGITLVLGGT